MIKKSLLFFFSFASTLLQAQDYKPEMADTFRENGKIYVVIAVIGIIFAALLVFLVYIERRLNKLEKQIDKQNQALK